MTTVDAIGATLFESASQLYQSKPHFTLAVSCIIVYVLYYLADVAKVSCSMKL